MSDKPKMLVVPQELNACIEDVAEAYREAIAASGAGTEEDVKLVRPNVKGLTPDQVVDYFILYSSVTGIWLTKKWIDTYLWPAIVKKIDKPSKALVDWITSNSSEEEK